MPVRGVAGDSIVLHHPDTESHPLISCLVADDHPAVLEAVVRVLAREGVEVVATARRGDEALARLLELRPDVALLDVRMPGMSGLDVARDAAGQGLQTGIVVYTGADEQGLFDAATEAGVRGFVLKDAPLNDVVRAVRTVATGGSYVDGGLAPSLIGGAASANLPELTTRQREVLRELADGRTYEEIGRRLSISAGTARVHTQNAMQRLEASTRAQAVATALRLSLIE